MLGCRKEQEAGVQPVLASVLLQVPARPRKQVGGHAWATVVLSIWLGCWRGLLCQAAGSWGQLMAQAVGSGLLPPPRASGCILAQEAGPEQSRLSLVSFVQFLLPWCLPGLTPACTWGPPRMPRACELLEGLKICHVSVGSKI